MTNPCRQWLAAGWAAWTFKPATRQIGHWRSDGLSLTFRCLLAFRRIDRTKRQRHSMVAAELPPSALVELRLGDVGSSPAFTARTLKLLVGLSACGRPKPCCLLAGTRRLPFTARLQSPIAQRAIAITARSALAKRLWQSVANGLLRVGVRSMCAACHRARYCDPCQSG